MGFQLTESCRKSYFSLWLLVNRNWQNQLTDSVSRSTDSTSKENFNFSAIFLRIF
ncbi:hypothetical protein PanWU01x14_096000, partial [Parasponia andersonii]